MAKEAKEIMSIRIDPALKSALDRICNQERDAYAPSRARIVERGIELALRELEGKRARKS